MENPMSMAEKNMEEEMETRGLWGRAWLLQFIVSRSRDTST